MAHGGIRKNLKLKVAKPPAVRGASKVKMIKQKYLGSNLIFANHFAHMELAK